MRPDCCSAQDLGHIPSWKRDHGRTVTRRTGQGGEGPAPWTSVSGSPPPSFSYSLPPPISPDGNLRPGTHRPGAGAQREAGKSQPLQAQHGGENLPGIRNVIPTMWQRNEGSQVTRRNLAGVRAFYAPLKGRRDLSVPLGQALAPALSPIPSPVPERTYPPRVIYSHRKLPSTRNQITRSCTPTPDQILGRQSFNG